MCVCVCAHARTHVYVVCVRTRVGFPLNSWTVHIADSYAWTKKRWGEKNIVIRTHENITIIFNVLNGEQITWHFYWVCNWVHLKANHTICWKIACYRSPRIGATNLSSESASEINSNITSIGEKKQQLMGYFLKE